MKYWTNNGKLIPCAKCGVKKVTDVLMDGNFLTDVGLCKKHKNISQKEKRKLVDEWYKSLSRAN